MERPFKITKLDTLFQNYATPEEYTVFANLTATLADPDRIEQFKRRVVLSALEKLAVISNGGLLAKILFKLPLEDVHAMCQVSTTVRNVCKKYRLIERFFQKCMFVVGSNDIPPGRIPLPFNVKMISAGYDFVAFITDAGKGYSFGSRRSGALGDGVDSEEYVLAPQPILFDLEPIVHISSGHNHMGFVTKSSKVYMCGTGAFGELGDNNGDEHTFFTPTLSIPLSIEPVKYISCGNVCTVVITRSEKIFFVGFLFVEAENWDSFIQIHPFQITTIDPNDIFVKISLGDGHLGILTNNHKLYIFGDVSGGKAGDGNAEDHLIVNSNLSYYIPNVKDVACTRYTTVFIDLIGSVHICDSNNPYPVHIVKSQQMEKVLTNGSDVGFISNDGNFYRPERYKLDFNHDTPISHGSMAYSFSVFVINELDNLLPISAPCATCGNVNAAYYSSDYTGAYCGKQCLILFVVPPTMLQVTFQ
jgi:hypothetical protein